MRNPESGTDLLVGLTCRGQHHDHRPLCLLWNFFGRAAGGGGP